MEAVLGYFGGIGDIALSAHVPFAEVAGLVTSQLKLAGEGGGLGVEPLGHAALFVRAAIIKVGSDAVAVWILTGGEGDAGRGADGGVDVEVGELDSFGSEAVNVLGVDRSSEAREVGVAHIIDENDDDVWLDCRKSQI